MIESVSPPEILVHGIVTPDDVEKLFKMCVVAAAVCARTHAWTELTRAHLATLRRSTCTATCSTRTCTPRRRRSRAVPSSSPSVRSHPLPNQAHLCGGSRRDVSVRDLVEVLHREIRDLPHCDALRQARGGVCAPERLEVRRALAGVHPHELVRRARAPLGGGPELALHGPCDPVSRSSECCWVAFLWADVCLVPESRRT